MHRGCQVPRARKELGLALLSPCAPSLSLGVGFALDTFFQLNRPDGGPLRGGTDGSNPVPSSRESGANRRPPGSSDHHSAATELAMTRAREILHFWVIAGQ